MNKIRANVWLGDYADAVRVKLLKQLGITSVINLSYELNDPVNRGVNWLKVGLTYDSRNQGKLINLAIDLIEKLRSSGESILVHCAAGMSRSPYVVAKWLADREYAGDLNKAYKELKKLHPVTDDESPLRRANETFYKPRMARD